MDLRSHLYLKEKDFLCHMEEGLLLGHNIQVLGTTPVT